MARPLDELGVLRGGCRKLLAEALGQRGSERVYLAHGGLAVIEAEAAAAARPPAVAPPGGGGVGHPWGSGNQRKPRPWVTASCREWNFSRRSVLEDLLRQAAVEQEARTSPVGRLVRDDPSDESGYLLRRPRPLERNLGEQRIRLDVPFRCDHARRNRHD